MFPWQDGHASLTDTACVVSLFLSILCPLCVLSILIETAMGGGGLLHLDFVTLVTDVVPGGERRELYFYKGKLY